MQNSRVDALPEELVGVWLKRLERPVVLREFRPASGREALRVDLVLSAKARRAKRGVDLLRALVLRLARLELCGHLIRRRAVGRRIAVPSTARMRIRLAPRDESVFMRAPHELAHVLLGDYVREFPQIAFRPTAPAGSAERRPAPSTK